MYKEDFDDSIQIEEYLYIFYKRKTLILSIFFLVMAVTVFMTFRATPIYQSTATMIIDKEESSSPITGQRTEYESMYSQELTFNTHFELILSKAVIKRVIENLNYGNELGGKTKDLEISAFKEWIRSIKKKTRSLLSLGEKTPPTESEKFNSLVNLVRGKVKVEEVEETRLLKISVKDQAPSQASQIANTLAKQYIEFNLANRMDSSKNTLAWMNNELFNLKRRLEDDEKAFFDFKQNKKVFSLESKQKMVDQKLSEFNSNYLSTRNSRLDLDAKIAEIEKNIKKDKDLASIRSLVDNKAIEAVYTTVKDLEIKRANLSKVFKNKHPKMVLVREELQKSRARLENELKKELSSLKSKRTVLLSRENVLKDTIGEFEQDALDTSGSELEYSILQRNLNTSKQLYDTLLAKIKESDLLKTSDSLNIRLVEEAITPVSPISPNKKKNILMGILLGLAGGVGMALILEYLDQTIRTEEDVQRYLEMPVLSVIPIAGQENGGQEKS